MNAFLHGLLFLGGVVCCLGPGIALILAADARKRGRHGTARRCASVALYGSAVGFPCGVLCFWLGNEPTGEFGPIVLMAALALVGPIQGIVSLLAWLFLRREDRRLREAAEARGGGGEE